MNAENFHSEWITIDGHRILLECRISFPDEQMKFIARVAVEFLGSRSEHQARIVKVFFNDNVSLWVITIASSNPEDKVFEKKLAKIFESIYDCGNFETVVEIVEPGNSVSDRYNHMQYLSKMAGVIK